MGQEGKTKMLARVTALVPWCASKKENLALALLELLVGEWAVPLRAFQGCIPMCASTTTGLKPPWEESSGPVMMIQCNLLSILYSSSFFIFFFYFSFVNFTLFISHLFSFIYNFCFMF